MLGTIWPLHALQPYHDDMLIVRLRPSARLLGRALAATDTPGLAALRHHEQAGHLQHVVPLGKKARRKVGTRAARGPVHEALFAAARDHRDEHPHSASVLVHLHQARHRPGLHRSLAADPHVETVSRVAARYLWVHESSLEASGVAEMLPPARDWNHAAIHLAEARRSRWFREPRRIRVAVLDTGVDRGHPDLRGRVRKYVHTLGKGHPVAVSPADIVGHGTHVAGIIAAAGRNELGISGICACDLSVFKVFGDDPTYLPAPHARVYMADPVLYRAALEECLALEMDVINLSLGGPAPPDAHEAALLHGLLARGTVIVAAMGNAEHQRSQPAYPAACAGVIAVGAVGPDGKVAPFSRRGRHMAVCAPGVGVWSTLPTYPGQLGFLEKRGTRGTKAQSSPLSRNTWFDAWPGTSMACPHVTAGVALFLAANGRGAASRVRSRLMKTADRLAGMRRRAFDPSYGAGRLNLRRLLEQ